MGQQQYVTQQQGTHHIQVLNSQSNPQQIPQQTISQLQPPQANTLVLNVSQHQMLQQTVSNKPPITQHQHQGTVTISTPAVKVVPSSNGNLIVTKKKGRFSVLAEVPKPPAGGVEKAAGSELIPRSSPVLSDTVCDKAGEGTLLVNSSHVVSTIALSQPKGNETAVESTPSEKSAVPTINHDNFELTGNVGGAKSGSVSDPARQTQPTVYTTTASNVPSSEVVGPTNLSSGVPQPVTKKRGRFVVTSANVDAKSNLRVISGDTGSATVTSKKVGKENSTGPGTSFLSGGSATGVDIPVSTYLSQNASCTSLVDSIDMQSTPLLVNCAQHTGHPYVLAALPVTLSAGTFAAGTIATGTATTGQSAAEIGVALPPPLPVAAPIERTSAATPIERTSTATPTERTTTVASSSYDGKASSHTATGLGKVYYFLDQMKLEVTEADKTIKCLQKDMKFLRDKNKELEARNTEVERRLHEERSVREAAEARVRTLRKKVKELKASMIKDEHSHNPEPNDDGVTLRKGETVTAGYNDQSLLQTKVLVPNSTPSGKGVTVNSQKTNIRIEPESSQQQLHSNMSLNALHANPLPRQADNHPRFLRRDSSESPLQAIPPEDMPDDFPTSSTNLRSNKAKDNAPYFAPVSKSPSKANPNNGKLEKNSVMQMQSTSVSGSMFETVPAAATSFTGTSTPQHAAFDPLIPDHQLLTIVQQQQQQHRHQQIQNASNTGTAVIGQGIVAPQVVTPAAVIPSICVTSLPSQQFPLNTTASQPQQLNSSGQQGISLIVPQQVGVWGQTISQSNPHPPHQQHQSLHQHQSLQQQHQQQSFQKPQQQQNFQQGQQQYTSLQNTQLLNQHPLQLSQSQHNLQQTQPISSIHQQLSQPSPAPPLPPPPPL